MQLLARWIAALGLSSLMSALTACGQAAAYLGLVEASFGRNMPFAPHRRLFLPSLTELSIGQALG